MDRTQEINRNLKGI